MGEVTQDELRGSAGGSVGPEISAAIEERGIGNKSQVHDGPSVKETADVVGRPTNNVGNDGQVGDNSKCDFFVAASFLGVIRDLSRAYPAEIILIYHHPKDMCTDKNEEQYEQSGAKVCASRSAMV